MTRMVFDIDKYAQVSMKHEQLIQIKDMELSRAISENLDRDTPENMQEQMKMKLSHADSNFG